VTKIINLFYLTPNTTGGWVTYLSHLMKGFREAGVQVNLYKVGNNTERKTRPFGYGEVYRNLCRDDALDKTMEHPTLIVAVGKKFAEVAEDLIFAGAKLVVHDPTELKNLPAMGDGEDCVIIRKSGHKFLPGATFIPHPYQRIKPNGEAVEHRRCVSISRIDFDKHTEILLDANRILKAEDEEEIVIRGFENRLYTRFKICPHYPEWTQSVAAYPREHDAAFNILRGFDFMADMSIIKGDGGGTQYTTLEAWDAGAIPIIQADWLQPDGEMVGDINCLSVEDAEHLALLLSGGLSPTAMDRMREEGLKSLKQHDAAMIAGQYLDFMEG
jgi:hypothetical protein|tara:strand:- start:32255 stop:33238 length:984 start_codon:yes stop_codon:yes gene_type:complete